MPRNKPPAGEEVGPGPLHDFLRAVMAELERVAVRGRDEWTVNTSLPVVLHASQLAMLGLWLLKGVHEGHGELAARRSKLEGLLEKAYHDSKSVWIRAMAKAKPTARERLLHDATLIRPSVMKAVKFFERRFGLHGVRLDHFTNNVQDALALLVGKVSGAMYLQLRPSASSEGPAGKQIPAATYCAVALGMVAGDLAGRSEITQQEITLAQIACSIGAAKDETGGPEPKGVKRIRKRLKELAGLLPE